MIFSWKPPFSSGIFQPGMPNAINQRLGGWNCRGDVHSWHCQVHRRHGCCLHTLGGAPEMCQSHERDCDRNEVDPRIHVRKTNCFLYLSKNRSRVQIVEIQEFQNGKMKNVFGVETPMYQRSVSTFFFFSDWRVNSISCADQTTSRTQCWLMQHVQEIAQYESTDEADLKVDSAALSEVYASYWVCIGYLILYDKLWYCKVSKWGVSPRIPISIGRKMIDQ